MGRNRNPDTERLMRSGQQAFRAELATRSEQTARRLATAYERTLDSINPYLRALINLADSDAIGLTRDLYLNQTTRDLQRAMREGLDDFAQLLDQQAGYLQNAGVSAGRRFGLNSLDAAGGSIGWNRPTVETIQSLVNYVDSPTFNGIINNFGGYYADYVSDTILTDASLGKSPRFTAQHIYQTLYGADGKPGMPLADANRIARTVQIYSARRGTQAIYQANRENMLGWWWSSARDSRTCMSCIANHGKKFSVDELLRDHHMGRCAMIPITKSLAQMGIAGGIDGGGNDPQTGEAWFNTLPESQQRQMMGNARFEAWRDGEFEFDALTAAHEDSLYGTMYYSPSLKQIRATAFQRSLTPGRFTPPTIQIERPTNFPYFRARGLTPRMIGDSFDDDDLTRAMQDLFAFDENGNEIFKPEFIKQKHSDMLYSIYGIGRGTPTLRDIEMARTQAGALLSAYDQMGIRLTRSERRQLQALAYGDAESAMNDITDNRRRGRVGSTGGGSSRTRSTAGEEGAARLRESNMSWATYQMSQGNSYVADFR